MSKYKAKETIINGIQFASKTEGEYYLLLQTKLNKGEIKAFELQPEFTLQDKFKKNGKSYRAIKYIADFKIIHNDGTVEIVDIKGMITPAFALKWKMFEKKYPYELSVIKYVKKYGGWITLDDYKKRKRAEKRGENVKG